jgi:hypothetical protein
MLVDESRYLCIVLTSPIVRILKHLLLEIVYARIVKEDCWGKLIYNLKEQKEY